MQLESTQPALLVFIPTTLSTPLLLSCCSTLHNTKMLSTKTAPSSATARLQTRSLAPTTGQLPRFALKAASSEPASTTELPQPEWLPEAAVPVLKFLNQTDFKLQDSDLYKNTLKQYVENKYVQESTGFKPLAEIINGRAAMLGFLAGASAEVFGAGPVLLQLSKYPQPVLLVVALITAGSIIPIVKGTEGGYLKSLRETYTLPEGVFTEPNERVHARLAMLGLGGLIALELLKGSALL